MAMSDLGERLEREGGGEKADKKTESKPEKKAAEA